MGFQEIFATTMYILIFSLLGFVLIYICYCKVKYGRFFKDETKDVNLGADE